MRWISPGAGERACRGGDAALERGGEHERLEGRARCGGPCAGGEVELRRSAGRRRSRARRPSPARSRWRARSTTSAASGPAAASGSTSATASSAGLLQREVERVWMRRPPAKRSSRRSPAVAPKRGSSRTTASPPRRSGPPGSARSSTAHVGRQRRAARRRRASWAASSMQLQVEHRVEHEVAPLEARLGLVVGVVAARALDEPGEQRGLGEVELADAACRSTPGARPARRRRRSRSRWC